MRAWRTRSLENKLCCYQTRSAACFSIFSQKVTDAETDANANADTDIDTDTCIDTDTDTVIVTDVHMSDTESEMCTDPCSLKTGFKYTIEMSTNGQPVCTSVRVCEWVNMLRVGV